MRKSEIFSGCRLQVAGCGSESLTHDLGCLRGGIF